MSNIVKISPSLISEVTGCDSSQFDTVTVLDLHLRDSVEESSTRKLKNGNGNRKIRIMENLALVPNIRQLNLSYNIIAKIEGLSRVYGLVELNLAENCITNIENLSSLKFLQRLNLSGNRIKRIPESISVLQSLESLRLARNELGVVRDLEHLVPLKMLTQLRIDENPFSIESESKSSIGDTTLFAVFHLTSLRTLDGVEITDELRESSFERFGNDEITILRSKITNERSKIARLREDVKVPRRVLTEYAAGAIASNGVKEEEEVRNTAMDAANNEVAHKLDRLSSAEKRLGQLESKLRFLTMGDGSTPADRGTLFPSGGENKRIYNNAGGEGLSRSFLDDTRDIDFDSGRGFSNAVDVASKRETMTTPNLDRLSDTSRSYYSSPLLGEQYHRDDENARVSRGSNIRNGNIEAPFFEATAASRHVHELSDRLERLTARLLVAEADKRSLRQQLEKQNEKEKEKEETVRISEPALQEQLDRALADAAVWKSVASDRAVALQEKTAIIEGLRQDLHKIQEENINLQTRTEELINLAVHDDDVDKANSPSLPSTTPPTTTTTTTPPITTLPTTVNLSVNSSQQHLTKMDVATLRSELSQAMEQYRQLKQDLELTTQRLADSNSKLLQSQADTERLVAQVNELRSKGYTEKQQPGVPTNSSLPPPPPPPPLPVINNAQRYLDDSTTSSSSESRGTASQVRRSTKRRSISSPDSSSAAFRQKERGLPTSSSFSVSSPIGVELQEVAAETIAAVMFEELSLTPPVAALSSTSAIESLKVGCARAALRVVQSSVQFANTRQQQLMRQQSVPSLKKDDHVSFDILPFEVLGSKQYLLHVIEHIRADLNTEKAAKSLTKEVKQLQKLIGELEAQAASAKENLGSKQAAIVSIEKHCEDAKRRANDSLTELKGVSEKLQDVRAETSKSIADQATAQRELGRARRSLKEALAASQQEHDNVMAVRQRVAGLVDEKRELEQMVSRTKEQLQEEETKLRSTKLLVSDQLRLLQIDLNKIQNDFKSKQHAIEELDKQQRSMDDEFQVRQRSAGSHLVSVSREVEQEERKLSSLKTEVRSLRLEVEQLTGRRRQAEEDLALVTDKLSEEQSKFAIEESEAKRRLEFFERQFADMEKRNRLVKEKVAGLSEEQILLQHSVDELRRQEADIRRAAELRRKSSDEELLQTRQQAQSAVRAARQATAQAEQKRAELDVLAAELRSAERLCEETKRAEREASAALENHNEALRAISADRERLTKETAAAKREEEQMRHNVQLLKATMETDGRAAEEIRRRIVLLSTEEDCLKESEARLRAALSVGRKSLTDAEIELDELRAASERERRNLSDGKTERSVLESELRRLEEEVKFARDKCAEEALRRAEVDSSVARVSQDLNSVQNAHNVLQKQISDGNRVLEDQRRLELELKASHEKLRLQLEGQAAELRNEVSNLEKIRTDQRDAATELRHAKDDLAVARHSQMTEENRVEALKSQLVHLTEVKDSMSSEVASLREMARLEAKRTEKLEESYASIETRLRTLQAQLHAAEEDYERTRVTSAEEQQRVLEQRRLLKATSDELAAVERSISDTTKQMYEQRQHNMNELSLLDRAKHSVQAQTYVALEAKRRMEGGGGGGGSGVAARITKQQPLSSTSSETAYNTSARCYLEPSTESKEVTGSPSLSRAPAPPSSLSYSSVVGRTMAPAFAVAASAKEQQPRQQQQPVVELSSLQHEVEKLRRQSSLVMAAARRN